MLAGASADFALLVSDDIRCAAAVTGGDRSDDLAASITDEMLFQHAVCPPVGVYGAAAKNGYFGRVI